MHRTHNSAQVGSFPTSRRENTRTWWNWQTRWLQVPLPQSVRDRTSPPLFLLSLTAMRIYGPYSNRENRQFIITIDDEGNRKTISYPKYLLEQKLGRKLVGDETCDHIDGNHLNNDLDNLQVLSRKDNARKSCVLLPEETGVFTCPQCNCSFVRKMRYVRGNLKKGKRGPYCSRSCAGKAGRKNT